MKVREVFSSGYGGGSRDVVMSKKEFDEAMSRGDAYFEGQVPKEIGIGRKQYVCKREDYEAIKDIYGITKNNVVIRGDSTPGDIVIRPEGETKEQLPPGTFVRVLTGQYDNVYAVAFTDERPWDPLYAKPMDETIFMQLRYNCESSERILRGLPYDPNGRVQFDDAFLEEYQNKMYRECVREDGYFTNKGASFANGFLKEIAKCRALDQSPKTLSVPEAHEVTLISITEAMRVPNRERATKINYYWEAPQWTRDTRPCNQEYENNKTEVYVILGDKDIDGTRPADYDSPAIRPLHKFTLEPGTLLEGQEYIRKEDGIRYKYIGKDEDGWDMGYSMEAEFKGSFHGDPEQTVDYEHSDVKAYLCGEYLKEHNINLKEHPAPVRDDAVSKDDMVISLFR